MASFTSRPVKAGLPTLHQLHDELSEREIALFQTIALVAIADEVAEAVEQPGRLTGRREEGSTC
jgi:hypothetical protein